MSVASYQSPNDYNLVKDIRPFEMPYSSYMQEIATKQQYWKIGADNIKSVYDKAAGLTPEYTENKDYLKDFMGKASKNLEKVSKSDLSILDNSQQAVTIFKPLFDVSNPFNANLIKDSQMSEHYRKQDQISSNFRTKEGGKEWNKNNEFYYKDAQRKYLEDAKNGDLSTIEKNFQNTKSFIPYYDYKKEVTDIIDACKGYSEETQDEARDPGYFDYKSSKGCDPQRLALAFQTGLSDRARQQMHIDGYAHFKGNEDTLFTKFKNVQVDNAKNQIISIETAIAGLKAGKIGKEEKAKIDDLTKALDIIKPRYEKNLEEYTTMVGQDPMKYVLDNYDRLSGQLYFDDITNQLGESFRTDEMKRKLLPNAKGMQDRKINADLNRDIMNNNHDAYMAGIEHGYKVDEIHEKAKMDMLIEGAKGNIITPTFGKPVGGNIPGTSSEMKVTEDEFIYKNLTPSETNAKNSYNELKQYIIDKYGKQNPDEVFTADGLASFVNEHNSKTPGNQDSRLKDLYDNFNRLNVEWKNNIDYVRSINTLAEQKYKDSPNQVSYSTELKDFKVVTKISQDKGVYTTIPPLSEKDMLDIIKGYGVKGFSMKVITNSEGKLTGGKIIYYNGKEIPTSFGQNLDGIYKFLKNVQSKKDNEMLEKQQYKTDIYTSKYYTDLNLTTAEGLISKDKSTIDNAIKINLTGITGGQNEKNGYKIIYRGSTGEDIYVVPLDEDAKENISSGPIDNNLAKLVGTYGVNNAGKVKTPAGWAYKIPGVAPRYPGLENYYPDLEKKNIGIISRLQTVIENDPKMSSKSRVDSNDIPGGTADIFTPSGKIATVSFIRGASTGITYEAVIEGLDRVFKANTVQNLISQLNNL